jgi:hypothetical protein
MAEGAKAIGSFGALAIFQQDWWMQIAKGPARLKEVQVHGANGSVIGRLTYIVTRNSLGIPSGSGPHLSRVNGPIVSKDLGDEEKVVVLVKLIDKLPNISVSEHTPNALLMAQAFKEAGFQYFEQINYTQPPGAQNTNWARKCANTLIKLAIN